VRSQLQTGTTTTTATAWDGGEKKTVFSQHTVVGGTIGVLAASASPLLPCETWTRIKTWP
jgi:hypothetical protein